MVWPKWLVWCLGSIRHKWLVWRLGILWLVRG